MTLAPRLKPIRVTGRRPWGRRDTGVHSSSRKAALMTAALAHLSAAALHFMHGGCAVPDPGSDVSIRRGVYAGGHLLGNWLPLRLTGSVSLG